MSPSDRLTTADVAILIGKSQRTVQRFIATGELPTIERLNVANGVYVIARSDAEALRNRLAAEKAEVSA